MRLATRYYLDHASPLIAVAFVAEIEAAIQTVLASPTTWPVIEDPKFAGTCSSDFHIRSIIGGNRSETEFPFMPSCTSAGFPVTGTIVSDQTAGIAAPLAAIIPVLTKRRGNRLKDLKPMSDSNRFTIICPCCEATLNVDADTGALLSHEEKHKPLGSFEDMKKDLDKQKQTREQIFAQEMSSMKDRGRLLEEKFQEAKKKAEKDTKIYRNPLDLD